MFSFKQYFYHLNEAQLKNAEILVGRFQPFHNGHAAAVDMMKDPVIVIVKGEKSSSDRERNPLTFEQQKQLIHAVYPNVPVFQVPNAHLPTIISTLGLHGYNVTKVYTGSDRIQRYRAMVDEHNKKVELQRLDPQPDQISMAPVDVEFVETPRYDSATTVRQAVRDNDFHLYSIMMPPPINSRETFEQLRKLMQ